MKIKNIFLMPVNYFSLLPTTVQESRQEIESKILFFESIFFNHVQGENMTLKTMLEQNRPPTNHKAHHCIIILIFLCYLRILPEVETRLLQRGRKYFEGPF